MSDAIKYTEAQLAEFYANIAALDGVNDKLETLKSDIETESERVAIRKAGRDAQKGIRIYRQLRRP